MNDPTRTSPQQPGTEPGSQAAPPPSEWSLPTIFHTEMQVTPHDVTTTQAAPHGGTRVDPNAPVPGYEILSELGRGGMGVVYKARQLALNRVVALKMVRSGDDIDARELIRFLAEAEAAAAVRHPHVVQVYDYGEAGGRPYMALEYCPGGTLSDWIRENATKQHPQKAVTIIESVARGVAAAHDAGIVHRDLKPANVLFDDEGSPKVADFGLAKRTSVDLTRTDAVMGTPAYMSPEQATGRTKFVGPQADVWSLGVILFEAVIGRRPFEAENSFSLIQKVAHDEAPGLRTIERSVPQDLDLICRKCLAKNPLERYPSAGELADELGRFLRGDAVSVRQHRTSERISRWIRRKPAVAAAYLFSTLAMTLLVVGASLAFLWLRAEQARDETSSALAKAEAAMVMVEKARDREKISSEALARTEYSRTVEFARSLALSGRIPTAARLLEACRTDLRGWEWDHVQHLAKPETRLLGHELGPVYCVTFRKDGNQLATAGRESIIRFWNPTTGASQGQLKVDKGFLYSVVYDPLRPRLVSGGQDGIVRIWDVNSQSLLHSLGTGTAEVAAIGFTPDGKRLAAGFANGMVSVWDAETARPLVTLTAHTEQISSLAFSPDGRLMATGSFDKTIRIWDVSTWKVRGSALKEHTAAVVAVAFPPSIPAGKPLRFASASDDGTIRLWDATAGKLLQTIVPLSQSDRAARVPRLGKLSSADEDRELWNVRLQQPPTTPARHPPTPRGMPTPEAIANPNTMIKSEGTPISDLAFTPGGNWLIAGRMDGSAVALRLDLRYLEISTLQFASQFRNGKFEPISLIRDRNELVAVQGAGSEFPLRGHAARVNAVAVSPDGQRVVTACDAGLVKVWENFPDTRPAQSLSTHYPASLEFAPDGKLAVASVYGERTWHSTRVVNYPRFTVPETRKPDEFVFRKETFVPPSGERLALLVRQPPSPPPVPDLQVPPTAAPAMAPTPSAIAAAGIDHAFAVTLAGGGQWVAAAERGSLYVHRYDSLVPLNELLAASAGGIASNLPLLPEMPRRVGPMLWSISREMDSNTSVKSSRSSYSVGPNEALTDVTAVALRHDGRIVAAARRDGLVGMWNALTAQPIRVFRAHNETIRAIGFSPDGSILATASDDDDVKLWHCDTGELRHVFNGHMVDVLSLAFSADGDLLVTGAEDGTLRVWDVTTGKHQQTLSGHTTRVTAIAWTRDGKRLASASLDRTIRLWDPSNGLEVLTLETEPAHVLAFSPDGNCLAAGIGGREVLLYQRHPIRLPLFPPSPIVRPEPAAPPKFDGPA